MAVIARFYVSEIVRRAYDTTAVSVTLQAVSRGEENKVWASATPAGNMTMTIKNGPAADFFTDKLGKDVFITIEAVDPITCGICGKDIGLTTPYAGTATLEVADKTVEVCSECYQANMK